MCGGRVECVWGAGVVVFVVGWGEIEGEEQFRWVM